MEYRGHSVSRTSLVGMRRDLIDKVVKKMEESPLFTKDCKYPRRYFDDLVIGM